MLQFELWSRVFWVMVGMALRKYSDKTSSFAANEVTNVKMGIERNPIVQANRMWLLR